MENNQVDLYVGGVCLQGTTFQGGYGIVLISGRTKKELSAGYKKTTGPRMELMGVVEGLSALKWHCDVTIYSNLQYIAKVFTGVTGRKDWDTDGWESDPKRENLYAKLKNADLWKQIFQLARKHNVKFIWMGENHISARCKIIALAASKRPPMDLLDDVGVDDGRKKKYFKDNLRVSEKEMAVYSTASLVTLHFEDDYYQFPVDETLANPSAQRMEFPETVFGLSKPFGNKLHRQIIPDSIWTMINQYLALTLDNRKTKFISKRKQ